MTNAFMVYGIENRQTNRGNMSVHTEGGQCSIKTIMKTS